jgi:hypothetical protein
VLLVDGGRDIGLAPRQQRPMPDEFALVLVVLGRIVVVRRGQPRAPPLHPQTNGMVERFIGRISEIVKQTCFASAAVLESTLRNYLNIYNNSIPQRTLGHQTPIQALKKWQKEKPDLFVKTVYIQAGLTARASDAGSGTQKMATRKAEFVRKTRLHQPGLDT